MRFCSSTHFEPNGQRCLRRGVATHGPNGQRCLRRGVATHGPMVVLGGGAVSYDRGTPVRRVVATHEERGNDR